MTVLSKVSGFDVKDEFPHNSAHFRNDNNILAYAKCRTEIDSTDKSSEFSSVYYFIYLNPIYEHIYY